MVKGPSVEVKVGMGGFAAHSVPHRAAGSPINIYIQEGEMAFPFGLHGELNALMDAV
jgi:hypothetical protein